MEKLLTYFTSIGTSPEELEQIRSLFRFKKIAKGDYFVEEGRTSKYLSYVTKGLFQYFYRKDGKEITTYASGTNAFLLSLCSFYRQQPSKENIRALADSEMWVLH